METSYEQMVQNMVANGIPEAIAVSIANSMITKEAKVAKKRPRHFEPHVKKEEIVLIHEDKCMTCGCVTSQRVVTLGYPDENETTVHGIKGMCHNCPKFLDTLDKEVLISLFMIQNHSDVELRMLSASHQIRLAQLKKPAEWIGYKITRQDMSKPDSE